MSDRIGAMIKGLSAEEMAEMLAMLEELDQRKRVATAQTDFLAFIAMMDPTYKFGAHLKRLGHLLMDAEEGTKDRIAVSMAPRFGKSQMISIYFPAWYLGRNPDHKIIVASHTADLAITMARKVRNLMQTPEYRKVFPEVAIAADAKAAGKWNTNKGGEYMAVGVGGALAGYGGDLIIVDDPLSEQDIKSGNFDSLDIVYEWYRSGLRTRLMPGGRIVALHCLVGDTAVTQADGSTKPLRDVRPGDSVLSYDKGELRPAKVLGWANQGLDRVYAIALKSGVIIRGNERHPLLVNNNGADQWVTIKNLKPGMHLVSTTGAQTLLTAKLCGGSVSPATTRSTKLSEPPGGYQSLWSTKTIRALQKVVRALGGLSSNQALVAPATPESTTTRKTPRLRIGRWDTMASGKVRLAVQKAVDRLYTAKDFVVRASTKQTTPPVKPKAIIIVQSNAATRTSKCAMGSLALSTTGGLLSKEVCAPFAESHPTQETPLTSGKFAGSLLTTATILTKYARCCATLATSWLKTDTPQICSEKQSPTLNITLDEILTITPDGEEEVFDIEVEGTENFLANGVVSHNTRWHQRDLIGRLLKDSAMNDDGDQYEMFEFPAILNSDNPEDHPTAPPKSLWPEQWSLESLMRTKASMPLWQWNAQYMQDPTARDSAMIKKEWIRWWQLPNPPQVDFIVQSWDTALTTKERSDWSVCQTWGVWTSESDGSQNVILLNSAKGKWEFPDLKEEARRQYENWQPDSVIIEAKASGQPLIDEMRRSGIFVQDFSPGKGNDKIARVNAIADMFASGQVWFPETQWAGEVVEELLAFPSAEHDDQTDALTLALRRVRQGGLMRLNSDPVDNWEPSYRRSKGAYTV